MRENQNWDDKSFCSRILSESVLCEFLLLMPKMNFQLKISWKLDFLTFQIWSYFENSSSLLHSPPYLKPKNDFEFRSFTAYEKENGRKAQVFFDKFERERKNIHPKRVWISNSIRFVFEGQGYVNDMSYTLANLLWMLGCAVAEWFNAAVKILIVGAFIGDLSVREKSSSAQSFIMAVVQSCRRRSGFLNFWAFEASLTLACLLPRARASCNVFAQ